MNFIGLFKACFMLLFIFTIYSVNQTGYFRSTHPHFKGQKQTLDAPLGIEDITTHPLNGTSYFASKNKRNGALYVNHDFNSFEPIKLKMAPLPFSLQPCGLSLLVNKTGNDFLFVINHDDENEYSILRFEVMNDSLKQYKRFTHELFTSAKDVLAIDSTSFYVTNGDISKKGWWRNFKEITKIASGNLVFHSKDQTGVVYKNLPNAHGVQVTKDQNWLFVASTTDQKLLVFKHENSMKRRILQDELNLGTSPEKIEIDNLGYLWVASHPNFLKYIFHQKNTNKPSPSQVLKIVYLPNTEYKFLQEEVFLSTGTNLSAAGVASYFHTDSTNVMWIGSRNENQLLKLRREF